MCNRLLKIALLAAGALSGATHAADTEIYLSQNAGTTQAKANVVFVIDTSTSMGDEVDNTPKPYDPAHVYAGDYDKDKIYYSGSGVPPGSPGTSSYFRFGVFHCHDAGDGKTTGSLYTNGYYAGNMGMFKGSKKGYSWGSFSTSYNETPTAYRECAADIGKYGSGNDTSKPYPVNGSAAWQSADAGVWFNDAYTIYTGNYMNYYHSLDGYSARKIDIIKAALKKLVDSTSGYNLALVRFDYPQSSDSKGGYFLTPMMELNDTNRQKFKDAIDANVAAHGFTPLSETLYEVTQFYRGGSVVFGDDTTPGTNAIGTFSESTYITPIKYQCQKNFVVVFTDGDPYDDTDANTLITALPGFKTATGVTTCTGNCLDELALYLKNADLNENTDFNGQQNVITYTIGFDDGSITPAGKALLEKAAENGGGEYFPATNAQSITNAFTAIITKILSVNTTFTAPVVSVNAFNRLTNLNDLYFAVFRPEGFPHWDGNIKHYKLLPENGTMVIKDDSATPTAAVDSDNGFFKKTAISYWHPDPANKVVDGDDVSKGGAAAMMPAPADRKVYTYLGNKELTDDTNLVHEDNGSITTTLLNLASYGDATAQATQRTEVLKWARGIADPTTGATRTQMGDPLHTEPLMVTYGTSGTTIDLTIYATTNEGYLHAFDANTGAEVFSFIPPDLLPNLTTLADNIAGVTHPIGLDGPLSAWVKDTDGTIGGTDHVYLYLTERRGGKNIYALDVTDRSAPSFLWRIKPDSDKWAELGDTWSRVNHAVLRYGTGNAKHDVVIFGGGFDSTNGHDDEYDKGPIASTKGRAIYIADAETGEQLWRACPTSDCDLVLPSMEYSIPSDLRVLDVNGDGVADRIYVGDTGGQLWRFDILTGKTTLKGAVYGGVIAKTSKGTVATSRKFYYAPSVSLSVTGNYLNIALGSGFREHPLGVAVTDEFFVVRDPDVYEPVLDPDTGLPTYTVLIDDPDEDLFNATSETTTCTQASATKSEGLASKHGWYFKLTNKGEKCLAQALTAGGLVTFTTFSPMTGASASACAASQGSGRLYALSAEEGTACTDLNGDGVVDAKDTNLFLTHSGIPPRPIPIHVSSDNDTNGDLLCIGPQCLDWQKGRYVPKRGAWKIINN